MQTNNGRAINVVKFLRNRYSKERQSPYVNDGNNERARKYVTNPEASSLANNKINRCLNAVELALRRSNQEEAVAAVERAFLVEQKDAITGRSYLEELGIRDGLIDVLNIHNIFTVGDLILMDTMTLGSLKGLKESEVNTLVLSVESLGFRFSSADDDS